MKSKVFNCWVCPFAFYHIPPHPGMLEFLLNLLFIVWEEHGFEGFLSYLENLITSSYINNMILNAF